MTIQRPLKLSLAAITAMAIGMPAGAAHAGERESLEQLRATTVNLINLLVQEGVLSKDKADALLKQAAQDAARSTAGKVADAGDDDKGDGTVRVQYVPEHVKNQLREEIKEEVMAKAQSEGWAYPNSIPDWLNRIEWTGDLRIREQLDKFPSNNALPAVLGLEGTNVNNSTEDRNRWRLRARLGANLKISDHVSGGISLLSGTPDNRVTPDQTLAMNNGSGSGKFNFALDRAFLKYDATPWLSATAGRFASPWFSTDLVWDPDIAFDGVVAAMKPKLSDHLTGFLTLGAFPIQEIEKSNTVLDSSKWLYGGQAGIDWAFAGQSSLKLGAAYYDFTNVQGKPTTIAGGDVNNKTAITTISTSGAYSDLVFHQKGNTLADISFDTSTGTQFFGLASQFREVDLTAALDIANFSPVHVVLTGDYVKNVGFDKNEIINKFGANVLGPIGGNTGWMAKLMVGHPQTYKLNDWNAFVAYKRLESNAVMDAFADSDFHLGGTNTKGYIVGANYGIDKNTWVTLRWFSADQIVGSPLAIDVLMLDLNARF